MSASTNVYANAFDQAFSGNINWASDSIKMALLTSSYTPNLATHVHFSDVSGNEVSGTGYSSGGVALGSKTHAVTTANSFATSNGNFTGGAWISATAAVAGNVVIPASPNLYLYECVAGGTTAGSAPTWPTIPGETVVDNSAVIWSCLGESITIWSSANASWSGATISAEYGVIYDATTGTGSTEPLIALVNLGGVVSSTASTFVVNTPSLGWFWNTPA